MFAKLTSTKLTSTKLSSTKLSSTKLSSTKLSSNRVSRQPHLGLRPEPMLLVGSGHANDNRIARRGPAGATKRPVLTCRWVPSATGGLECRWLVADGEATRADEPGAVRERPVAAGGRHLTLVAR
jgi:hypothetical protein